MKIIAATKNVEVLEALQNAKGVEVATALFTGQVNEALGRAQLAIVDFDELVPHPFTVDKLKEVLVVSGVQVITSQDFLTDPQEWLAEVRKARPAGPALEQRTIAFTSYSGGTGKTTLALDTALHFHRRSRRPTLLVEFTYGRSALESLTGLEMPDLYGLVADREAKPAVWNGVTLVPMNYERAGALPSDLVGRHLTKLIGDHILTVVDLMWPHGLRAAILDKIHHWFVLAVPRPDAVENARQLGQELPSEVSIILNRSGGAVDSLATAGLGQALNLPELRAPLRWDGNLGRRILPMVYSDWKKYEPDWRSRLPFLRRKPA